MSFIGRSVPRLEDGPLVTGRGRFAADIAFPHMLHMRLVRSGHAHGRAVNPMLIEGQLAGGLAQGVGGALLEEFLYDERGEPLSVNFADYLMPTAREVPPVDVLITQDAPSPLNPLGIKGAGEGGINAVGAAIASAIDDAIGIPGAITRLPVTPHRLRMILKRAGE